jgi:membrane protein DedA with SNARE-associated domain
VGENWEDLQHNLHYFDYVLVVAIVGGVVWLVLRHRRRKRRLGMAISPAVADDGSE